MSEKHIGEVVQVTGPVLDIRFPEGELPALLNAIEIDNHGEKLVVEVAQQTGDNMVRCIAMKSTDGLVSGTKAVETGGPIAVPVGEECLGRVFNLLGDTVDNKPAPETAEKWPIHLDPRQDNRWRRRNQRLQIGELWHRRDVFCLALQGRERRLDLSQEREQSRQGIAFFAGCLGEFNPDSSFRHAGL